MRVFILVVLIFVLLVMWRHKVLPPRRDPVFLDDQETFLDKPIGYGSEWLSL